jgi:hypothetical protein
MTSIEVICSNRLCRLAHDGKCLEGYEDLEKCPNYGREPVEGEDDEAADEERLEDAFDGIRLADALPLATGRASRLLAILPSRMLGIIGAYDSGKTSVIAGLYDLFQMGPVSGLTFAGSSTLHGLELICHDARAASDRD